MLLITPDALPVEKTVSSLEFETAQGAMGILAGHQDGIFVIASDWIRWTAQGTTQEALVSHAVLSMNHGDAFLYAETMNL